MDKDTTPQHLQGLPLFLGTLAVSLATFLIVLDYSIANVSIPYISGDLAVSVEDGTYVITSFAVGSAIVLPITGWLTRRLGMIRLIVLSLLMFSALSWLCGISRNIVLLVSARFFQGIAAGPMIPLSQTLIVQMYPPEKKNAAISFWSTVVVVAPIVGPILGGWISYDYYWPWIFFINIPVGVFSALVIKFVLYKYETPVEKVATDWIGLILLTLTVSCLQFLLDKGEQYDWLNSDIIRTCAIISFTSFAFLIPWELFHSSPILELSLLKIRSFSLSVLFIAVMYSIYFGSVVLIPLWLQTYMGYTSIWAGLSVASMGVMPALFSSLMGKLTAKFGSPILLFISFILFALSSFDTAYMNTNISINQIIFSRFLLGFAILFFIVPDFALQVRDMPNDKLASSAGLFHFVRAMMGGVGTSVFTTLWIRRSAFHHSNLTSQILDTRPAVNDFYTLLESLGFMGEKKWVQINELINTQAAVLGINDCFFLMGWCFLALIPLLFFAREKKSKASQIKVTQHAVHG
ncbi:MAG: DHA2 family efflux MFS transporter permease subunit [Chlamydiales bacterium]